MSGRNDKILVRCPVCSTEAPMRLIASDPPGTRVVIMVCASCTTKKAKVWDCTYLDAEGREIYEDGSKGPNR